MTASPSGIRPPLHLIAAESDRVADLALRIEGRHPVIASMLLQEIERAELHTPETLPSGYVTLDAEVTFVDEKSQLARTVQLVMPAEANIAEGRISIATPMGAALYGMAEGASIEWPDLGGNSRAIRIIRVVQPKR